MKLFILFLICSFTLISCSGKSDVDYLNEAKKSVEEKDITGAITAYEKLIEEFPESKHAADALYELASLYQNRMLKDISEYESLDKASKYYRQVYDKYPESERAPRSLFMSAFLQANDLKKFKEATESYKLFLEKFPDHELAPSAKAELDFMGESPDNILKQNTDVNI